MENPFPIPRGVRETEDLLGNGGVTYGPFSFQIFDPLDVQVWIKAQGASRFTKALPTISKVSDLPLDFFTITFPAPVPETTRFRVRGSRRSERSAGVTSGTRVDQTALEKEFSKMVVVQQEQARDIDQRLALPIGEGPLSLAVGIADGAVLMRSGSELVQGPIADEIAAAQAHSVAAGTAAFDARASATEAEMFADVLGRAVYDFSTIFDPETPGLDWSNNA